MTDMVPYDDYLYKVLPDADGCPPIVAEDKIRDAVMEICQETSLWRKELDPFFLTANVPTYKLILDDNEQLAQISWGYLLDTNNNRSKLIPRSEDEIDAASADNWRALDGHPKFVYMLTPETVRLAVIPNAQFTCVLGLIMKPTEQSYEAPKFIFDQYADIVAAGAKAKLLNMKGRTWYDPAAAEDERLTFKAGKRDIRNAATKSHTRGPKTVTQRPLV